MLFTSTKTIMVNATTPKETAVPLKRVSLDTPTPNIIGIVSDSIKGTNAFIVKMAKVTPSGNGVYWRINTVNTPQPIP